jgi:phosphoribosylanthranilate isomerase
MTKVKICGITNLEDALHAVEAGADELGFNFYRGSKRYITPEAASEVVGKIAVSSGNIGVFVNEPLTEVLRIARLVGLDGIQLHGDEDDRYVRELKSETKCTVIKAFRVSSTYQISGAMDWSMDFPLFDAYSPNEQGGTGQAFGWEEAAIEIRVMFPYQAYLAGGLTPENVAGAVSLFGLLYAVDVATGVESSPGRKDPDKVAAFIKAAKEAI